MDINASHQVPDSKPLQISSKCRIKGRQAKRRQKKQKFDSSSESENDENSSVTTSGTKSSSRFGDDTSGRFTKHLKNVFNVSNRLLPNKVLTHWTDEKAHELGASDAGTSWSSWTLPISVSTVSLSSLVGKIETSPSEPFIEKELKSFLEDEFHSEESQDTKEISFEKSNANNHPNKVQHFKDESPVIKDIICDDEIVHCDTEIEEISSKLTEIESIHSKSFEEDSDKDSVHDFEIKPAQNEPTKTNKPKIEFDKTELSQINSQQDILLENVQKQIEEKSNLKTKEPESQKRIEEAKNFVNKEEFSAKNLFDKKIVHPMEINPGDIVSSLGSWFSGIKKATAATIPSAVKIIAENASNILDTVVSDFPVDVSQPKQQQRTENSQKNLWEEKNYSYDRRNSSNSTNSNLQTNQFSDHTLSYSKPSKSNENDEGDGWDDWNDEIIPETSEKPTNLTTSKIEDFSNIKNSKNYSLNLVGDEIGDEIGDGWNDWEDSTFPSEDVPSNSMLNKSKSHVIQENISHNFQMKTIDAEEDRLNDWGGDSVIVSENIPKKSQDKILFDKHSNKPDDHFVEEKSLKSSQKETFVDNEGDGWDDWEDNSPIVENIPNETKVESSFKELSSESEDVVVQEGDRSDWLQDPVVPVNVLNEFEVHAAVEDATIKSQIENISKVVDAQVDGWDDWEDNSLVPEIVPDKPQYNSSSHQVCDDSENHFEKIKDKVSETENVPTIKNVNVEGEGWDDLEDEPVVPEACSNNSRIDSSFEKKAKNHEVCANEKQNEPISTIENIVDTEGNGWNDWQNDPVFPKTLSEESKYESLHEESSNKLETHVVEETVSETFQIDCSSSTKNVINVKEDAWNDWEDEPAVAETVQDESKNDSSFDQEICANKKEIETVSTVESIVNIEESSWDDWDGSLVPESVPKESKIQSSPDERSKHPEVVAIEKQKETVSTIEKAVNVEEVGLNDCNDDSFIPEIVSAELEVEVSLDALSNKSQTNFVEKNVEELSWNNWRGDTVVPEIVPNEPKVEIPLPESTNKSLTDAFEQSVDEVDWNDWENDFVVPETLLNEPKIETLINEECKICDENEAIPNLQNTSENVNDDSNDLEDNYIAPEIVPEEPKTIILPTEGQQNLIHEVEDENNKKQIENIAEQPRNSQNESLKIDILTVHPEPIISDIQPDGQPSVEEAGEVFEAYENPSKTDYDIIPASVLNQNFDEIDLNDNNNVNNNQDNQNVSSPEFNDSQNSQISYQNYDMNQYYSDYPQLTQQQAYEYLTGQDIQSEQQKYQEYHHEPQQQQYQQQHKELSYEQQSMHQQQYQGQQQPQQQQPLPLTQEQYEEQMLAWQNYYYQTQVNQNQANTYSIGDYQYQQQQQQFSNNYQNISSVYSNYLIQQQTTQVQQQFPSQTEQQFPLAESQFPQTQQSFPVAEQQFSSIQQPLPQNEQQFQRQEQFSNLKEPNSYLQQNSEFIRHSYYLNQQQQPFHNPSNEFSTSSSETPISSFSNSNLENDKFSIVIDNIPNISHSAISTQHSQPMEQQNFFSYPIQSCSSEIVSNISNFESENQIAQDFNSISDNSVKEIVRKDNLLPSDDLNIENAQKPIEGISKVEEIVEAQIVPKTWPQCSDSTDEIPKSDFGTVDLNVSIDKAEDNVWDNNWDDGESFDKNEDITKKAVQTEDIKVSEEKVSFPEIVEAQIVPKTWPQCSDSTGEIPKSDFGTVDLNVSIDKAEDNVWDNNWDDGESFDKHEDITKKDIQTEDIKDSEEKISFPEIVEAQIVPKTWPQCSDFTGEIPKSDFGTIDLNVSIDKAEDNVWDNNWDDGESSDKNEDITKKAVQTEDIKVFEEKISFSEIVEPQIVPKTWPQCSDSTGGIPKSDFGTIDLNVPINKAEDNVWDNDWDDDEGFNKHEDITKKDVQTENIKDSEKKISFPEIVEPQIVQKTWPQCCDNNEDIVKNDAPTNDKIVEIPKSDNLKKKNNSLQEISELPIIPKKWPECSEDDKKPQEKTFEKSVEKKNVVETPKDDRYEKVRDSKDKISVQEIVEPEIVPKKWPECSDIDEDIIGKLGHTDYGTKDLKISIDKIDIKDENVWDNNWNDKHIEDFGNDIMKFDDKVSVQNENKNFIKEKIVEEVKQVEKSKKIEKEKKNLKEKKIEKTLKKPTAKFQIVDDDSWNDDFGWGDDKKGNKTSSLNAETKVEIKNKNILQPDSSKRNIKQENKLQNVSKLFKPKEKTSNESQIKSSKVKFHIVDDDDWGDEEDWDNDGWGNDKKNEKKSNVCNESINKSSKPNITKGSNDDYWNVDDDWNDDWKSNKKEDNFSLTHGDNTWADRNSNDDSIMNMRDDKWFTGRILNSVKNSSAKERSKTKPSPFAIADKKYGSKFEDKFSYSSSSNSDKNKKTQNIKKNEQTSSIEPEIILKKLPQFSEDKTNSNENKDKKTIDNFDWNDDDDDWGNDDFFNLSSKNRRKF